MEEEFRTINGHEAYSVSNYGRVIGTKGTPLKPSGRGHKRKYQAVALTKGVQRYVHHLVLETFVGPRPAGLEVRHLDGDPSNNRLDNLVYGTSTENGQDMVAHGNSNRGERMWKSHLDERRVRIIRGLCKLNFPRKRIAEICSVTTKTVSDVYRRRSWAWVD